jgi:hypothetical protein
VNELPAGLNVMSLHFMLPEGAKVKEFYLDNTPSTYFKGKEADIYPVAYKPLQLWALLAINVVSPAAEPRW